MKGNYVYLNYVSSVIRAHRHAQKEDKVDLSVKNHFPVKGIGQYNYHKFRVLLYHVLESVNKHRTKKAKKVILHLTEKFMFYSTPKMNA